MPNALHNGIIYCRVSDPDQVKGTSLESQKRACLAYADSQGINVIHTFIEKGESATAANRTEFLKALDFCRERKDVSAFIVWKIDRFARNTTDHFAVRAKLLQQGVTLHSVTEPISQDPQGKLMETLLAGFAEFENEVRKQRCTGGMQARLRDGIWCWMPPIGYIHSKKLRDRRKLRPDEPDPERFCLVQKALKTYATGQCSMTELAKLMNRWGFRTRTGLPMRVQLVERMLKDKFYAGILVDPWTGEEYHGQHEPMITREEYQQIQVIKSGLSNNAVHHRADANPDFPLRGTVFCTTCSRKLTAGWTKGRSKYYAYYHCKTKGCRYFGHTIPKRDLEEKFLAHLEKITPDERFLRLFESAVIDTWRSQQHAHSQERRRYAKELQRLETRKTRLIEMRLNGEVTKQQFDELNDSLENQKAALSISHNESHIEELDMETAVSYTTQFLRHLPRQWQDMKDIKHKQRLQKLVLPKGIVYDKATGEFGTAVMSPVFRLFEESTGKDSDFVAEVGQCWHQVLKDMYAMGQFAQFQEPHDLAA